MEIATPTVRDPHYVDPDWVLELLAHFQAKQGFWLSLAEAQALVSTITDQLPEVTRLSSYGRRGTAKTPTDDSEDDK